jgi:hypothetical protein
MPSTEPTSRGVRLLYDLLYGLLWVAATCFLVLALAALVVMGIVLSADSGPMWTPGPIAAWVPAAVMFASAHAFRACAHALCPFSDEPSLEVAEPIIIVLFCLGCLAAAVAVAVVAIRLL